MTPRLCFTRPSASLTAGISIHEWSVLKPVAHTDRGYSEDELSANTITCPSRQIAVAGSPRLFVLSSRSPPPITTSRFDIRLPNLDET